MKFVRKIGAHKIMIALVAGNIKAIIGNATIGIPKPIIPLINPPHNTAKKIIPYSFECKNKETFKGIYDIIDQAKSNADKRETPIGIIKMNKQQPLAILDAEHFLKMIGKL